MSTGNMNVTITLGKGNKRLLSQKITVFKADEILEQCPDLKKVNGNASECFLQVNVSALRAEEATLVVQYTSDELQLFDGIPQAAQGDLSTIRGRYFYYAMDSAKPTLISLKSITSNKYRILAKIIGWNDYLRSSSTSIYPLFVQ